MKPERASEHRPSPGRQRLARLAAWSAALLFALAVHAAALSWLAPRFQPGSPGSSPGDVPGLRLALAAVALPAPAAAAPLEAAEAPSEVGEATPEAMPVDAPAEDRVAPDASGAPLLERSEADDVPTPSDPDPGEAPAEGANTDAEPSPTLEPTAAHASGASAGAPGTAGSAGGEAARERYIDRLSAQVQSCIRYPRRALRRRIEGDVELVLWIASDGRLERTSVVEGSASALLVHDAVDTVERCAPYPPPPAEAGGAGAYEITLGYELL